ncbi:acetamidase/formamidase [Bifidobacterium goeldii]|uniref:Acetamidase/formamidase n=1 Tax=Bifidobacterium goeldii TaxID=2306975 RepID=A0A430FJ42_9BIFI|nr:acetamidase/formamidase family protein [Bifidobacterium goeldii]RSX52820.1 acetamidase/formamidase [Bifidobacterium goeldii]
MIELSNDHVIFAFDKQHAPALTIESGQTVRIHTQDCFSEQIKSYDDSLETLDWDAINPATGPIYVKGAQPGDVLKAEILDIELNKQAVCSTGPNEGVLGDRFDKEYFHLVAVGDGKVAWDDKLSIPIQPMIGVIGVAPAGEAVNCGTPNTHGGNMDSNKNTIGTTLYFPVNTEGALFACGDMHAAMGNGEIGVSGAEIGGVATIRLTVIHPQDGESIDTPWYETADEVGVIYSAPTLDEAADKAVHLVVDAVAAKTEWSVHDLTMLFSISANVEVCQMVDPLRTVRFAVPKSVLNTIGFSL